MGSEMCIRDSKKGAPVVKASENPTTAQLWPHVHGTDAMFLALLRKN